MSIDRQQRYRPMILILRPRTSRDECRIDADFCRRIQVLLFNHTYIILFQEKVLIFLTLYKNSCHVGTSIRPCSRYLASKIGRPLKYLEDPVSSKSNSLSQAFLNLRISKLVSYHSTHLTGSPLGENIDHR